MSTTIPSRLFERAKKTPQDAAYYEKVAGQWKMFTWATYADQVKDCGRALMALGFSPGQTACILGNNCPQWVLFDVATMAVGGAPAGIYVTSSPSEVAYILKHSECPIALVEDFGQLNKVLEHWESLPALKHVVLMPKAPKHTDERVLSWDEFIGHAAGVGESLFFARVSDLKPTELATLIYTSGTTGPPKGVMLTHENLAFTADIAGQITGASSGDSELSYLPLSHIAEQNLTIHVPITQGYTVYFAESLEKVRENISEVRPTVMFGVPRIWEKMYAGVKTKLAGATGVKAALAQWAMNVGRNVHRYLNESKPLPLALQIQYKLADRLIYSKVKAAMGLDRCTLAVSGAAPISQEIIEFFAGLDIVIREIYGQSEDTGPTTFNFPGRTRFGSVGVPVPGVDVHIADDGEILVRGKNVFAGYYKDPEATAETLHDGWLHSGDLGRFDEQGFLYITGRKKDIIITAGGKNIAPKNIEAALKNHPLIGEAVVIGDRRPFLSALISLDPELSLRFAADHGVDPSTLATASALLAELNNWVEQVNKEFARVEWVRKFHVVSRPFSTETGELTPSLKVKRSVVNSKYAKEIDQMYHGEGQ